MAFYIDPDSRVAMPRTGAEYADWRTAKSVTIAAPMALYPCVDVANSTSLTDVIGGLTASLTGAATGGFNVAGWSQQGPRLNMTGDWWSFNGGGNLATTGVAGLIVVDINTLSVGDILHLGGTAPGDRTTVELTNIGRIKATRGANSLQSTFIYTGVVAIFAVLRPGVSDFSVYIQDLESGLAETLTPTWSVPPGVASSVFICNGFVGEIDATVMRLEYWNGVAVDLMTPANVAAFMTARFTPITNTYAGPKFEARGALATGGSGTTMSPIWPVHQANDIGILTAVTSYNSNTTPATPAGWNLISSVPALAGGVRAVVTTWWKRAASAAEVAPNIVTDATDPSCVAQIVTFRGCVSTGTPYENLATAATGGAGSIPVTFPAGSTSGANRLVVNLLGVFLGGRTGAGAITGPANAGFTLVDMADSFSVVAGEYLGIGVLGGEVASASAIAASTGTAGASLYASWGAFTFALLPEVVTPPDTASLGGIMTVILLAQPTYRHQRQIIYGPKKRRS